MEEWWWEGLLLKVENERKWWETRKIEDNRTDPEAMYIYPQPHDYGCEHKKRPFAIKVGLKFAQRKEQFSNSW